MTDLDGQLQGIKNVCKLQIVSLIVNPKVEILNHSIVKRLMYFISSNKNNRICFSQGYMPDDLKAEALSKIHKQCIGCVEQSMKLLEFLDSLVSQDIFLK